MEQNGKTEKIGDPSSLPDEDTTTKLLSDREIPQDTRKSWDAGIPKDTEQANLRLKLSSKDVRRLFRVTVWDLQKPRLRRGSEEIGVYKRRWVMLFIGLVFGMIGAFQWPMYSIISNVIEKYYNVSSFSVHMTGMVFFATYILTFLPAGWIFDRTGTRRSVLLGCAANAVGCLLRVFTVPPERFWIILVCQAIVGLSQIFLAMIPVRIAAVWFPADQVSLASSIGFNGMMIGNAIGCVLPPILVRNSDNLEEIGADLNNLYLGLTTVSIFILIVAVLFFQEKPPLPPSLAQKYQQSLNVDKDGSVQEFVLSLKRLMRNKPYLILLLSLALNVSVFISQESLLNEMLIHHFPGHEKEIGVIGLLLIASGVISSFIFGYVLGRTNAFKTIIQSLYIVSLVGWIAFAVSIQAKNMTWVFIATVLFGFAQGNQLVALDFAVEVTFPEPEGTAGSLMWGFVEVFGITVSLIYGYMLHAWGDAVANGLMIIPILLGCGTLLFMRPDLKRQAAQQQDSTD